MELRSLLNDTWLPPVVAEPKFRGTSPAAPPIPGAPVAAARGYRILSHGRVVIRFEETSSCYTDSGRPAVHLSPRMQFSIQKFNTIEKSYPQVYALSTRALDCMTKKPSTGASANVSQALQKISTLNHILKAFAHPLETIYTGSVSAISHRLQPVSNGLPVAWRVHERCGGSTRRPHPTCRIAARGSQAVRAMLKLAFAVGAPACVLYCSFPTHAEFNLHRTPRRNSLATALSLETESKYGAANAEAIFNSPRNRF
ncbi:hypothetical protein EVAR_24838_1 [Eumeta japonica]|uniref:Uncharacterized protein n=1 Tax=Eumeta variegata TaxID=151549 RepID=A0A4C1YB64_EUMVA|nr:hypothetical protein EVAR_24838_1 [Eumeta japonica]